jgi:hypothetical protein
MRCQRIQCWRARHRGPGIVSHRIMRVYSVYRHIYAYIVYAMPTHSMLACAALWTRSCIMCVWVCGCVGGWVGWVGGWVGG